MDLFLGMIFDFLGDSVFECVFDLTTRILHCFGAK